MHCIFHNTDIKKKKVLILKSNITSFDMVQCHYVFWKRSWRCTCLRVSICLSPLPQRDGICPEQVSSVVMAAAQNSTSPSWEITYPRPLHPTQLCSYPETHPPFSSTDPIYTHYSARLQTLHWTEGKTLMGHRKRGRPRYVPSWRDHPHSSQKMRQRVEQRCRHAWLGTAKQHGTETGTPPTLHTCILVPKNSADLLHPCSPSLVWLHPSKAEHTVSAASPSPSPQRLRPSHCPPLPNFPSHTFGFSTFFPVWTSCHITGLPPPFCHSEVNLSGLVAAVRQGWSGPFLGISTAESVLKGHQHHSSQNAEAEKGKVPVRTYQIEENNLENW